MASSSSLDLSGITCRFSQGSAARVVIDWISPTTPLLLPSSPHHSGRKSSIRISGLSLNILRFLHGPCQSFCASILSPSLISSLVQSSDIPHCSYHDSASTSRNPPYRSHVQALIPNERSRGEGCEVEEVV